MIHVVAKDMREYNGFLATKPSSTDYRYVHTIDSLRGLSDIEGLFIGTCYDRPDFSTILNMINTMRHRNDKSIIHIDQVSHLSSRIKLDTMIADECNTTPHSGLTVAVSSAASSQRFIVSVPYAPATSTTMLDKELFDMLTVAKTYGSYTTNVWNKYTSNYEFIFTNVSHAATFSADTNGVVTIQ